MAWQNCRIELPYDVNSLIQLIQEGERGAQSNYCHWQIIEWCSQLCQRIPNQGADNPVLRIADDIVVQWELYLSTQYTLEQLDRFNQSDVLLPRGFFTDWLHQLQRLTLS